MMITNEWNHISKLDEAVGENIILLYPNAATAEATVHMDKLGNIHYELAQEENYLIAPNFWRFKSNNWDEYNDKNRA